MDVWLKLWRSATTKEERDHLWEVAKASDEMTAANTAFMRSTFVGGRE